MPSGRQESANDVTIAVVGDGFGALLVYVTAVYLGFKPEQVGIFGERTNPVGTYQQFAWNLGQTVLRSESESHFLPADWPTFAQMDAYARRSPAALARSVRRKFNPGVAEVLAEAQVVTRNLGYPDRVLGGVKVGWIAREPGEPPYFSLYDERARLLGRARHVIVAVGHGPLSFPGIYGAAREDAEIGERIVQAYEPKTYFPGGRYIVVGSGIAAVNEWVNVLEAGAQCIAMRRNPEPEDQDLNVPRCLFDGSGIDAFQGLSFEQRMTFLGRALRGTSPTRRNWGDAVSAGLKRGTFEEVIGEATEIGKGPAGLTVSVQLRDGRSGTIDVTGVICATGFVKSALALPVVRRLAETYDVPIERERVRLKSNCGVPPLDRDDSRLAMMGLSANTAVPNADTIAGLKYIARRFVGDCARAERLKQRSFASRLAMQVDLGRKTVAALRSVDETEQLA